MLLQALRSDQREQVIRQAFDVIADAQKASAIDELDSIVRASFASLGFTTFVGLSVLAAGGRPRHGVLFGATHKPWEQRYAEKGYARHDAVLRELVHASQPIVWSDLPTRRPLLTMEKTIYAEAAEFGLTDGLVTPIPHLDGSLSAVMLAGQHIDAKDVHLRSVAHLLSLYYGGVAERLRHQTLRQQERGVRLSRRQLECLKWTRHGKSSTDIGDILGINAKTVDEHLAEACERLGVRTRVQAAVEAALMGLID